jgi:DeoR/GlpR family transcriptional regulator of sugar metabolism
LFLGVDGIEVAYVLFATNLEAAILNKMMQSAAQNVIILVDVEVFYKRILQDNTNCLTHTKFLLIMVLEVL